MSKLVMIMNVEDLAEGRNVPTLADLSEAITNTYEGQYEIHVMSDDELTHTLHNGHDGLGWKVAVELEPVRIHRPEIVIRTAEARGRREKLG